MALSRVLSMRLRAAAIACAVLVGLAAAWPSPAIAQGTRTLKLHFTHTGERGVFTFRRNGQYDRRELDRINHILRDWRRNEPTRMDPMLLDLIWEIHRRTGSNEYVHIISAYRSPATNESLRKRSSGVAKQSQHTRGKAMDFFIPGVPLSKLRAIALTMQGGGVGYYPGSGSPFVHVDTGSVRHWPRMTRQQLASLFPNGETLHLPSDGKPLAGYQRALAKRKSGETIAVASVGGTRGSAGDKNVAGWLKKVFSGGADQDEDDAMTGQPTAAPQPTEVARANVAVSVGSDAAPLEVPTATPSPRPTDVEVAVAADETGTDVAATPMPRAVPGKTRLIILAARERAQLAEMASAAVEPAVPPAIAPQTRPAAPVAVAALGNRAGEPPVDATSADAALAGLYAAAEGGNPEPGPARLVTAAIVQEQTAVPANRQTSVPSDGNAIAALDGIEPSGNTEQVPATAAVDALSVFGRGNRDTAAEPKLELAYAPATEKGDRPATTQSARPPKPAQAHGGAVTSGPSAATPTMDRPLIPAAAPMPPLALHLDRPLLQRLMSNETTRTATFVSLARPQPKRDLYAAPETGGEMLKMVRLGQPRTDRFQLR